VLSMLESRVEVMVSSVTELMAQVQLQEQSHVFPPLIESAAAASISIILFSIFILTPFSRFFQILLFFTVSVKV